jgi:hypothetical protein
LIWSKSGTVEIGVNLYSNLKKKQKETEADQVSEVRKKSIGM